jgi:hypothetical protein
LAAIISATTEAAGYQPFDTSQLRRKQTVCLARTFVGTAFATGQDRVGHGVPRIFYTAAESAEQCDRPADAILAVSDIRPSAWVFPLKFTGGGLRGPGKLMIDSNGYAWTAAIGRTRSQQAAPAGSPRLPPG